MLHLWRLQQQLQQRRRLFQQQSTFVCHQIIYPLNLNHNNHSNDAASNLSFFHQIIRHKGDYSAAARPKQQQQRRQSETKGSHFLERKSNNSTTNHKFTRGQKPITSNFNNRTTNHKFTRGQKPITSNFNNRTAVVGRYNPRVATRSAVDHHNHRHRNDSSPSQSPPPPKVEKRIQTSITVARSKGSAKYCYGCGASLVKREEQEITVNNDDKKKKNNNNNNNNNNNSGHGNHANISLGLQTSTGGFWQQKSDELKISKIKNWGLCPRCKSLQKEGANDDAVLEALSPSTEMTKVFREQVGKIRSKSNAVVILCVDAVNVKGSLIATLRNYVGGNPILLAVTRCDLLPQYVRENFDETQMKQFFANQAAYLNPAQVYLCSVASNDSDEDEEDDNEVVGDRIFRGTQQLAKDLWNHLDGRDPYVVGAANIGKSTLTDRLIAAFVRKALHDKDRGYFHRDRRGKKRRSKKEEKKRRYEKRSDDDKDSRRYDVLLQSRVTKSSLPGTTLQNIRVPCFPDYTQALWDTPGLLLDPSLAHYPIRNLRRLKAMRPKQIQPQWHTVHKPSFAFLIYEDNNSEDRSEEDSESLLPLLRIEVRLKRDKTQKTQDIGPVHLVWNSILGDVVSTSTMEIDKALQAEQSRVMANNAAKEAEKERQRAMEQEREHLTPAERASAKEQRIKEHEEREKAKRKELGFKEWEVRQQENLFRMKQMKSLVKLELVNEEGMTAGKVMELDIPHFGSLVILSPRDALIRVFAPSRGIVPNLHDAMTTPSHWEDYVVSSATEEESTEDGHNTSTSDDEYSQDWEEKMFWADEEEEEMFWANEYDAGSDDEPWDDDSPSQDDSSQKKWSEFSGEHVGWIFHDKPHFHRGEFVDGWMPKESKD